MGTPEFAEFSLSKILEFQDEYEVKLVLTQQDKPQGRKRLVLPSPVKFLAEKNNIEVFQPKSLKSDDVYEKLKLINPDFIVVVAYGKILPKRILDLPELGAINVHGSILPRYRGAAPIQWSFIRGEEKFGVTTMFMDEGVDTGNIILKREIFVNDDENFEDVYPKLGKIGADLLVETLNALSKKSNSTAEIGIVQDNSQATFAPMLEKKTGKIDWNREAREIHNLVRGCCVWPVAYTFLDDRQIKIYKTKVFKQLGIKNFNEKNGAVIGIHPLTVRCGNSTVLQILELQIEGKRRMSSDDFCRGNNVMGKVFI